MPQWICELCQKGFARNRSGSRPIRFCSQTCYHAWRDREGITTGQFAPGLLPWNKGTKGIMQASSTSFTKGQASHNHCPIGAVQIRTRKRDNIPRAWIKIAEPNHWKLRAVVVWETQYGHVPEGCVVHHMDRNPLNDTISNLAVLSRAAHLLEHRHEFEEKRRAHLSRKRNPSRVDAVL
jgi:hypothetical protein